MKKYRISITATLEIEEMIEALDKEEAEKYAWDLLEQIGNPVGSVEITIADEGNVDD
jgi:hypothetical protein